MKAPSEKSSITTVRVELDARAYDIAIGGGLLEEAGAHIAKLKPKLQKLKERFGSTTEDLAAMALNYVLAHPRVACVIPGFRNERQARCNLAADGRTMSKEDLDFIRKTLV